MVHSCVCICARALLNNRNSQYLVTDSKFEFTIVGIFEYVWVHELTSTGWDPVEYCLRINRGRSNVFVFMPSNNAPNTLFTSSVDNDFFVEVFELPVSSPTAPNIS